MDDPLWRDGRPWLFFKKENQIQKSIVIQSAFVYCARMNRERDVGNMTDVETRWSDTASYRNHVALCLICWQSDVVHQSVYELVHSEDREELQRQLTWSSQLAADSGLTLLDALRPDNSMILERSFTVRFRCLLDNTSGFLVRPFFSISFWNCWNFFEIRSVSHGPGG